MCLCALVASLFSILYFLFSILQVPVECSSSLVIVIWRQARSGLDIVDDDWVVTATWVITELIDWVET